MSKIKLIIDRDDGGKNNRELEIIPHADGKGMGLYHNFPDSRRATCSDVREETDPVGYRKLSILKSCIDLIESPGGMDKLQALLPPATKPPKK